MPKRRSTKKSPVKDIHKLFKPNKTPKEVFQEGAFGGTYFRRIRSSVTNETYSGVYKEFPKDWFEKLDIKKQVTSAKYQTTVNRYKVKCGGDLHMWESSGWISNIDPYGWFQWYCRYYLGRRSPDDQRQVKRWRAMRRHIGQIRNNCRPGDLQCRPRQRQALLHWAYDSREM